MTPTGSAVQIQTLAQISQRGSWQVDLAHAREYAMLIWITKGQGLALLDGRRRGVGLHNAFYIPAGHLFSLALGRPGFALVVRWPKDSGAMLPEYPLHLRTRDAPVQNELTILLDALGREQDESRPFFHDATRAHGDLIAIWLQRQTAVHLPELPRDTPSRTLSRTYCQRLAAGGFARARMADHAEAMNVTPTHLSRVTKSETGRSAAALLSETTLHAAKTALMTSNTPIGEIASQLGFASAAYFTRFMHRHTGQSPSNLRGSSPRG